MSRVVGVAIAATIAGAALGCQGSASSEPPIHLNLNMDFQARFDPQEENAFFLDKRAMRPDPQGTVAHGSLLPDDRANDHLRTGKVGQGYSDDLPRDENGQQMVWSEALLDRGQKRFDIYCAPCHGATGHGDGIVVARGMTQPQSYLTPRLRGFPLGQIVHTVTFGSQGGKMASYAAQIPPSDRWAIAAWVRVLQVAGTADAGQLDPVVANLARTRAEHEVAADALAQAIDACEGGKKIDTMYAEACAKAKKDKADDAKAKCDKAADAKKKGAAACAAVPKARATAAAKKKAYDAAQAAAKRAGKSTQGGAGK